MSRANEPVGLLALQIGCHFPENLDGVGKTGIPRSGPPYHVSWNVSNSIESSGFSPIAASYSPGVNIGL